MGNMDFLVAWDYTMISRDKFIGEIEGAAKYGDAQIVYREGEDEDDLSSDVERVVERHVKQKEIEKSERGDRTSSGTSILSGWFALCSQA